MFYAFSSNALRACNFFSFSSSLSALACSLFSSLRILAICSWINSSPLAYPRSSLTSLLRALCISISLRTSSTFCCSLDFFNFSANLFCTVITFLMIWSCKSRVVASGNGALMALVEVLTACETTLRITSSDGRTSKEMRWSRVSSCSSLAKTSAIGGPSIIGAATTGAGAMNSVSRLTFAGATTG